MGEAINLYLRSWNAHVAVRNLLLLLQTKTIKNFVGKVRIDKQFSEISTITRNVFKNLQKTEKHCKVLAEEVLIKPGFSIREVI